MTLTVLAPSHLQLQARTSWRELNRVIGSSGEVKSLSTITVTDHYGTAKNQISVLLHPITRWPDHPIRSVLFGYCAGQVHGREQDEDVRLKQ